MNKKRLLILADFLDTVPEDKFDLEEWTNAETLEEMPELSGMTCEATACAIGWASAVPEFKKLGFHFIFNSDSEYLIPCWEGNYNWEAVESFFDLTLSQAERLFLLDSYHSLPSGPKDVAKAIRQFVKNN